MNTGDLHHFKNIESFNDSAGDISKFRKLVLLLDIISNLEETVDRSEENPLMVDKMLGKLADCYVSLVSHKCLIFKYSTSSHNLPILHNLPFFSRSESYENLL